MLGTWQGGRREDHWCWEGVASTTECSSQTRNTEVTTSLVLGHIHAWYHRHGQATYMWYHSHSQATYMWYHRHGQATYICDTTGMTRPHTCDTTGMASPHTCMIPQSWQGHIHVWYQSWQGHIHVWYHRHGQATYMYDTTGMARPHTCVIPQAWSHMYENYSIRMIYLLVPYVNLNNRLRTLQPICPTPLILSGKSLSLSLWEQSSDPQGRSVSL